MRDMFFRLGENKYRVNRKWLQLPKNKQLGAVSGIAVDNKGQVYVLQRDHSFILIFSNDGALIGEWKNNEVNDGHNLRITPDGRVLVVDRDYHRVLVFSSSGELLQQIGDHKCPGRPGFPFNHPADIAINKDGDMFIADGYANHCIHHFNSAGELIKSWGKVGKGPGEFSVPHSVVITKHGKLLVADRENGRLQMFNQCGEFIKEITDLRRPMAIDQDADGFIYVTDQTPRIIAYDANGEIIGSCRSFGNYSHGIAVDSNGNIFTAEMNPNFVTKFEKIPNA